MKPSVARLWRATSSISLQTPNIQLNIQCSRAINWVLILVWRLSTDDKLPIYSKESKLTGKKQVANTLYCFFLNLCCNVEILSIVASRRKRQKSALAFIFHVGWFDKILEDTFHGLWVDSWRYMKNMKYIGFAAPMKVFPRNIFLYSIESQIEQKLR